MDTVFLFSLFLSLVSFVKNQSSISTIPDTDNGDAYLAVNEGEINVTVVCIVFSNPTNQVQTPWHIQRQGEDSMLRDLLFAINGVPTTPSEFVGDIFATGELIPLSTNTYLTNLTFLNFTSQFDTTHLQCGDSGLGTRNFFLGFPVSPIVNDSVTTQFVTENGNITVDLNVAGAEDPFPPTLSSVWVFNGQNLTSSSDIILNKFDITLNSVQRNMTGSYTLTITNSIHTAIGSFELDVQFPPGATTVGATEIVVSGSSITLIAFLPATFEGNPVPTVSWTGPEGLPRTTSGRFNTSVQGLIIIINITNDDNGTYTCVVSNGIGRDLSQTVKIVIAIPASPPKNLVERDVTDTTVNLTWSPPEFLGLPDLSFYQLMVSPPPPSDVNLTTTATSLLVYGIIPNTQYNVTVVGVSTGDNFDILEGEESNLIIFKTATGAPSFNSVTAVPLNGTILIQWTLRHTGGLNIDVYSYCEVNELGAKSRLVSLQLCDREDCYDGDLTGNTTIINDIQSGKVYSCTVTAVNSEGTDERAVTNVFSNKGLPSTPIILFSSILPGRLTLIVSAELAGAYDGSFRFNVDILNSSNRSFFRIDTFLFSDYTDGNKVNLNIDIADGGSFTFVVKAENSFGRSVGYVATSEITIRRVVVSVSMVSGALGSMAMSEDFIGSCTPIVMLEGELAEGIVGGIIVAVIIILVIIGLVIISVTFIVFKTKGNKEVKGKVSNRNLNVPPYNEFTKNEKVCEQPDHLNKIYVEQNIAYGEVKSPIYL